MSPFPCPDLAEVLRGYLADKSADASLFRRSKFNPMRSFRRDLAAAGIEYSTAAGFADFHALRHTFITNLFDTGAKPKEAQTLARHQDPKLTLGRYAHVGADALRCAIERLPGIWPNGVLEISNGLIVPAITNGRIVPAQAAPTPHHQGG